MYKKFFNHQLTDWATLCLLSLIWGSSYVLMKKGLQVYAPQEIAALRILTAATILMPLSLPQLRQLRAQHYLRLGWIGLLGALVPALLFAQAQVYLDSALNGALTACTPIATLIVGRLCFTQPIPFKKAMGAMLGMVGTVLLIFAGAKPGVAPLNYYVLLPLLGCFFLGANAHFTKHYSPVLDTYTITSVSFLLVGCLSGLILIGYTHFWTKLLRVEGAYLAAGYILMLGTLGSAGAYLLLNSLLRRTSPVFVSMTSFLVPIVALAWGWLDGEVLLWGHHCGIAVILWGVYLVNGQ